jgi:hypothetical protein
MEEAVTRNLTLKVQKMEMLKHFHRRAHLWFEGGCWPPSNAKELASVSYAVTSAIIHVNVVDAV